MLQIITGRFFTTDDLYRTSQHTVLYSNLRAISPIESLVGSYTPAGSSYDVETAVYAVEQKLEATSPDGSRSVLVAVDPQSLAQDFAALLSFYLEVTCTLDSALVSRLTQSHHPPVGVHAHPSRMVPQVFDREVQRNQVDASAFPEFVADLVRLRRTRYVGVMRAIRRYVVGLHRIGDDLPLAYTLLVASIESLAHAFDEFDAIWPDYDESKRRGIDQALRGATAEVRRAVRNAVLENEHVALGRRYREFALAHLPPSFYREEAADRDGPARARDLPQALTRAYEFRSRLVHRLEDLPGMLVHAPLRRDIIHIDGKPTLTFSGLARVARRVIRRFVELSPKLEREEYDYRRDLPGVIRAPMAPRYWIWRAENYHTRTARRYLGGFLSELESVLLGQRGGLTDLGAVLETIEERVPGLARKNRLPMVALYFLYHRHMVETYHRPDAEDFLAEQVHLFDEPSIESLVCHAVLRQSTGWKPQQQEKMRTAYFAQRHHRNGLSLGPVLEAALTLHGAEAFQAAGDAHRAAILVSEVVENLPGNAAIFDLEIRCQAGEQVSLSWRELLLPEPEDDEAAR